MKKKRFLMQGALCAMLMGIAGEANAAQTLRVQVDQKGDFVLIGNTLGHECAAGTPAPVVGTVGNCGTLGLADTAPDIFWRSDAPANGQAQANNTITVAQARSTAVLSIPAGATVTHAYLYWGANFAGGDNTVTLDRPGGFTQAITAGQMYTSANNSYQGVADITSLVQANGPGAYRVSGVNSANFVDLNNDNNFAGWWMVVFYGLATDPPRNLALFDGLDPVSNGAPQNLNLSGFLVPAVFNSAKLGVVAFEGDNAITGDSFSFGPAPALTDALNPATNFFNGTHSRFGLPISTAGDLPQLTGTAQSMSGMDIDTVDVTAKLMAGQTTVPISATSTGDVYYLAGFVTSIPTFKPDFGTSQKTAVDLNGGALLPGDVVEYTVVATNTGNDTSVNTVMNDALPMGVTYVPGSISITAGANAGTKTDPNGDDQCEYTGATRTVTCRLGTGANAAQGGQMVVNASTTIKFRVTIDATASGTINNQAIITAAGLLGAPPDDTPTDGNGAGNGQPPTPIVIDQCATDAECMAPTPYCKTVSDPNVCVQCLTDVHCTGTTPTCNQMTNTCVCVPSGMETCDGKDNDCNGQVDEGFNVGMACTSGVGQCSKAGTMVCATPTTTICDAEPFPPSPETCDGLDNDCDGVNDNGNPGGGMACMSGLPGVCSNGTTNCTNGMPTCDANIMPGQNMETCNSLDDDCDGAADDGFNIGMSCTVGVGACANTGMLVCMGPNGSGCSAMPGQPQAEICGNGIDDDCDGVKDNGCLDTDGDGIPDVIEVQVGTNPNDADSDDDGVIDGDEPDWNTDSDGDGLINALDPDSDNDGLFDGTELGLDCSNPATNTSLGQCIADADMGMTKTDPLDKDTDNGGISDGSEDPNRDGVIDPMEGDPNNPADDTTITDSDGDGLSDAFETQIGSNPNDADTDDDGVIDGLEPNPTVDSDGDGLINVLDVDSDNDGLYDGTEMGFDCSNPATDTSKNHCIADADMGTTKTSPLDRDTDNGGISDGSEDPNRNGTIGMGEGDPNDPADDSSITDSDGDGLSDVFEMQIGSNPNDADSDDDGVPDGLEPNPADDTDGDGKINVLDRDSDGDGIFDGTEMGFDCSNPATDTTKMSCTPDADKGGTKTSPLDPDTDNGGVPDGVEDTNKNGKIDPGEGDPNDPADDMGLDTDGDGLTNAYEMQIGSDPNDADSDDDGVIDGLEIDPATDSDGDGLPNVLDSDSDNDGLFDGTEMGLDCSNPATNPASNSCIADADKGATTTDPLDPDTDNGGISDGSEDTNKNGQIDPNEGDPNDPADDSTIVDTDGDGLSDAFETQIGSDPNDADSDDDGVIDGQEANPAEDSDGDGLINVLDPDSDNDGLFDGTELGFDCNNPATDPNANSCIADADKGATTTSPLDPDTDHGGIPDGSEDTNKNGTIDSGEGDPNDPADDSTQMDSDGDGLSDAFETAIGSDPNDADTDDDGVLDGQEPNPAADSDGDGLINVLDSDSDNDGLFDGTEMGRDCTNPATNTSKNQCVADADKGNTTTSPVDPDTDDGGISDGSEDFNHNGQIDAGEGDPLDPSDDSTIKDSDGDGLSDGFETSIGSDPNDADSDDDGVPDGKEANPAEDTDGDGKINVLDNDSDNDGLFDGTEMGFDCSNPATDASKNTCIPDGDQGMTTTSPLDADTDNGGVPDGTEDANHNGVIDTGETNPNNPADDVVNPPQCTTDADCGNATSGKICDAMTNTCVDGCRGTNGNGCPEGKTCTSTTDAAGVCQAGEPEGSILITGGCACRLGSGSSNDSPVGFGLAIAAACAAMARRRKRA